MDSADNSISFETTETGVTIAWPSHNIRFQHSFVEGELVRRARQSNQAILKACSNKKKSINTVLDLTGGWAQDSFILATHGKNVTLLEKNETVFKVIKGSLATLEAMQADSEVLNNLNIVHNNSLQYLNKYDQSTFDCIYLDPMFPSHKSSAKPAKSLQLLQQLTDNEDIEPVFELALQKAGNR